MRRRLAAARGFAQAPALRGPAWAQPVTDLLHARLLPEDVAEVERRLDGSNRELWDMSDAATRRQLALSFGVFYGVEGVLERTGLSPAEPPDGVHATARGSLSAGGGYHDADYLVEALQHSGGDLRGGRALDFGCSSGRVVRVLQRAFPDVAWHGCDPIPDAIEWASANLPGIGFALSPTDPPLPYEDGAFDVVFAVSIWSHFPERAARAWFAEMERVLAPGGRLVFTTHGRHAIANHAQRGLRGAQELAQIRAALDDAGFWYAHEPGELPAHGVDEPAWGTAFMTAEWVLATLCPPWRALYFSPGRNASTQDLFVLQR